MNFKHPEGLAILHKLIRRADVLVENYISGKLASMGLGWEDCHKLNPRLIYASITGEPKESGPPILADLGQDTVRLGHIVRQRDTT